jgi:hypothetical protein
MMPTTLLKILLADSLLLLLNLQMTSLLLTYLPFGLGSFTKLLHRQGMHHRNKMLTMMLLPDLKKKVPTSLGIVLLQSALVPSNRSELSCRTSGTPLQTDKDMECELYPTS